MKPKSIHYDSVFEKHWHKYLSGLTEKQKKHLRERRFLETGIGTRGVRRKDKADPAPISPSRSGATSPAMKFDSNIIELLRMPVDRHAL
jgi:hypothetical protein